MKWYWWLGLGVSAVAVIAFVNRKKVVQVWTDLVTIKRINGLHPSIRERVKAFVTEAGKQGINLRVTSGLRTFGEQEKLYNQPIDKIDNDGDGLIDEADEKVSQAKPGSSFHNYGLAIDVVEMKDGRGLWENPNWAKIGAIGKSFGFEWGGDWRSFKDLPHFQYPAGVKVSALLAMHNAGKLDAGGFLLNIA